MFLVVEPNLNPGSVALESVPLITYRYCLLLAKDPQKPTMQRVGSSCVRQREQVHVLEQEAGWGVPGADWTPL